MVVGRYETVKKAALGVRRRPAGSRGKEKAMIIKPTTASEFRRISKWCILGMVELMLMGLQLCHKGPRRKGGCLGLEDRAGTQQGLRTIASLHHMGFMTRRLSMIRLLL